MTVPRKYKSEIKKKKDGTYKISYFAKETGTCETSVKVNGEHVRGSPFEVQVRPRQFRPVLSFGQKGSSVGMIHSPWGLAVNKRNEIILADTRNNRVQIFIVTALTLERLAERAKETED